jgi:hypothetical protein
MSEAEMVELVQDAVKAQGINDTIVAAGQFEPRGHTGSAFAGGMIGGDVGEAFGGVGDAIGTVAGFEAGHRVHDAASGLPAEMLVGVSDTTVYGFAARSRRSEPTALVFKLPRAGLTAKVHQRVNVRVLELIEDASGSRVELEGNRIPLTHSKDVITLLTE